MPGKQTRQKRLKTIERSVIRDVLRNRKRGDSPQNVERAIAFAKAWAPRIAKEEIKKGKNDFASRYISADREEKRAEVSGDILMHVAKLQHGTKKHKRFFKRVGAELNYYDRYRHVPRGEKKSARHAREDAERKARRNALIEEQKKRNFGQN